MDVDGRGKTRSIKILNGSNTILCLYLCIACKAFVLAWYLKHEK
jgi:hypothetical protein